MSNYRKFHRLYKKIASSHERHDIAEQITQGLTELCQLHSSVEIEAHSGFESMNGAREFFEGYALKIVNAFNALGDLKSDLEYPTPPYKRMFPSSCQFAALL